MRLQVGRHGAEEGEKMRRPCEAKARYELQSAQ